jgi:hypothetical protein
LVVIGVCHLYVFVGITPDVIVDAIFVEIVGFDPEGARQGRHEGE